MTRKTVGLWTLVFVLAVLSVATISGQLRINRTNQRIADQAVSGQKSLDRQCKLLPVGRKIYTDALRRGVVTAADYDLVVSTANTACPRP